jgi:hypothetical protein
MQLFQEVLNRFRNVRNDILQHGTQLEFSPPPAPPPQPVHQPVEDVDQIPDGANPFLAMLQTILDKKKAIKKVKKKKQRTVHPRRDNEPDDNYESAMEGDDSYEPDGATAAAPLFTPARTPRANKSTVSPAGKLNRTLMRNRLIREHGNNILFIDQPVSMDVWSQALNYLTHSKKTNVKPPPQEIERLSEKIYNFMKEEGEDLQPYAKYPVFNKYILTVKKKMRSNKGSVDNNAWDNDN